MKHILFNLASKTRPAKFNNLVNYIYENCSQPFTILAKVDDDDPTRNQYDLSRVTHVPGVCTSKIEAINKNIPDSGWDIICDISDDFVFTKPGFDNIIREHCGPDDYLHFPEDFADKQAALGRNERIVIMYCAGRDYYRRFGYIYNPVYKSLFCDNEGTAVARLLGRHKEVNEVIFFHAHPSAGYGVMDAQTRRTEAFYKEDQITYLKRQKEGFGL